MARITAKKAATYLLYVEAELLRDDISPEKRTAFEGKAEWYRKVLADRCQRCGRKLTDPDSIERRLGSECATQVA